MLKVTLVFALLFSLALGQQARGLNGTRLSSCSGGCKWTDSNIWADGIVPATGDYVSLTEKGTYTIIIDTNITVGDLKVGIDDNSINNNNGKQTLQIVSGYTLTSTSAFAAYFSSAIEVQPNANLIISQKGTSSGTFTLNGFASFGGSDPSLLIDTKDIQNPIDTQRAKLRMGAGSVLIVPNGLTISGFSNLYGSGSINGTLNLKGNAYPGGDKEIGSFNIVGDLILTSTTEIYIDVGGVNSFDSFVATGQMYQDGDLNINTVNSFSPLAHSQYIIFNYTSQRNGFDNTEKTCKFPCIFNLENKWQIIVDQRYSAILYDSATTVLISFALIGASIFFTLF